MTLDITNAEATNMLGVRLSPAAKYASSNATIGFTYA